MSEVREIWEQGAHLLDQVYAGNVPYHRSHQVVVELLPKRRPIRILDLGAGTGLLAQRILECLPDGRITCVDFSARMVEEARRRLRQFGDRAEVVCADIAEWAPALGYDAIVTCNALVYKEIDLPRCYRTYAAALSPGGLFLNSTVVAAEEVPFVQGIVGDAAADTPPVPEEAVAFARGPGAAIAHFGEGSLAVAFPVETHLELMRMAGLRACCPWHYLQQAVILGQIPSEG